MTLVVDLTKLRAILALAKSPTEWIEVDQRTLVDMANEIEAARAVVGAAGKLEMEMTNPVPCHVMRRQHRDELTAALAAYRAKVGGEG